MLHAAQYSTEPLRSLPFRANPEDTVRMCNELAQESSSHPQLRRLAASLVRSSKDVPREGPTLIGRWIRANIVYTQETVGEEILQGPHTTLQAGTGDCDDLSILWATLCRSVGLDAYVVGLRRKGAPGFFHAVGYADGLYYELSRDETYGGPVRGLRMNGLPAGTTAFTYDPLSKEDRELGMAFGGKRLQDLDARATRRLQNIAQRTQKGLDRYGIQLPAEVTGGGGGIVDTIMNIGGGPIGAALGGSGTVAGTISGTLGLSGIAGPIGVSIAATALAAKGLSELSRARRSAARAGNRYDFAVGVIVDVLLPGAARDPRRADRADLIVTRFLEATPFLAQTSKMGRKRRKRGRRQVLLGSLEDRRPLGRHTWMDGTTKKRKGVFEAMRPRMKRQKKAMNMHTDAALTLASSLSQLPLEERRRAFTQLMVHALGRRAAAGVWPARRSSSKRSVAPLLAVGALVLAARNG